jgi:uncharacterized protein YkwD
MSDYLHDWYYLEPNWRGNSFARGPFTIEQMRELIREGKIVDKTQVRCGSGSYWHPLREVSAIFAKPSRKAKQNPKSVWLSRKQKVILLIIVGIIAIFSLARRERHSLTIPVPGVGPGVFQEQLSREAIIGLTNNIRTLQGLSDLSENALLDAVAEARAKDLLEKQYFEHVSPTGEQASDVAQRIGYRYKVIAENLASGLFFTNQKVVDGWMQSPGHRRNILSPDVKDIGVSVIKGKLHGANTCISVQIFGLQSPSVSDKTCASPSPTLLAEIEAKTAEIKSLNERLNRLRQELDSENDSIALDRTAVGNDSGRNYELSVKIQTYNEKSSWHNQSLAEVKAKQAVLSSMLEEYKRADENYRNCRTSH